MACLDPLVALIDHRVADRPHTISPVKIFSKSKIYLGLTARQYRDEVVKGSRYLEALDLPCGQCFECRLAQSREWANRLVFEAKTAKSALFLTLTYDDEHLPHSDQGFPTLRPEDLRAFNKALTQFISRKFGERSPRYFECGEYGSQTLRPHYHSIHFNLDPAWLDLQPYKCNFRGDPFYKSEVLTNLWGKGFVVVGKCTWDTCAYVARYVTKKLTGDLNDKRFEATGCVQEFTRMSNRPGIGAKFFEDHKDMIYGSDGGYVYVPSKKYPKAKSPRYFDKLFGLIDEEALKKVKVDRSTMEQEKHWFTLDQCGWTEDFYNELIRSGVDTKRKKLNRRSMEV